MKFNRRDFLIAGTATGILAKTGLSAFAADKNSNENF